MNRVKIGVIVAALGLAGLLFWRSSSSANDLPDTEESQTLWMCSDPNCAFYFQLTASECQSAEQRADGTSPLFCQQCDKKLAYRAATCLTCNTPYFGPDVPGSSGRCPVCNPQAPIITPRRPVGPQTGPQAVEEVAPERVPAKKRKSPPAY